MLEPTNHALKPPEDGNVSKGPRGKNVGRFLDQWQILHSYSYQTIFSLSKEERRQAPQQWGSPRANSWGWKKLEVILNKLNFNMLFLVATYGGRGLPQRAIPKVCRKYACSQAQEEREQAPRYEAKRWLRTNSRGWQNLELRIVVQDEIEHAVHLKAKGTTWRYGGRGKRTKRGPRAT